MTTIMRSIVRKALLALFLFAVLALANYYGLWPGNLKREIHLSEVGQESILRLTNIGAHRGAERIDILISGNIDGRAVVCQSIGGEKADVHEIGPGKVSQRMGGPWNSSSYTLQYKPIDAKNGQLKVRYNFRD